MLAPNQQKEIVDYLISKRLSYDLASEIYDHMYDQINELQNEGFSFNESWEKVQVSWLSELKMTYDVRFSLDDIAEISKRIMKQRNRILFPKALGWGVLLTIITYFILAFISMDYLRWFQIIFVGGMFAFIISCGVFSYRYNQESKSNVKFENPLTRYQSLIALPASLGGFLAAFSNFDRWVTLKTILDQALISFSQLSGKNLALLVGIGMFFMLYYFSAALGLFALKYSKQSLEKALAFKKKVEDLQIQLSK